MSLKMQAISELQASGQLPESQADDVKAKFARLHAALNDAMQRERQLLEQARVLKRQHDSDLVSSSHLPARAS